MKLHINVRMLLLASSPGPPSFSMLHSRFSVCNIEKLGEPGDAARIIITILSFTMSLAYIQIWVKQYKKILSIVHIASLRKVYLGLDDGSVLMYNDELPTGLTTQFPACITLDPLMEYMDSTQTSSCLLAIPRLEPSTAETNPPQSLLSDKSLNSLDLQPPSFTEQPRGPQSSGPTYELWVGQKNGLITILNAETLEIIAFIQNPLDLSRLPSYVAYLSYAHLIYGVNSESVGGTGYPGSSGTTALPDVVSVYGALYHGQYVTRWNTENKTAVESFNCEGHLEQGEGTIFINY